MQQLTFGCHDQLQVRMRIGKQQIATKGTVAVAAGAHDIS